MNNVLKKIATIFKGHHIDWALGGSKLLSYYDIVQDVHDIDIIVNDKSINKALFLLNQLGQCIETPKNNAYLTEYFYTFMINEIKVDVMSNFKIKYNTGIYRFKFNKEYPLNYNVLEDIKIPLCRLEDWYLAYLMMEKREEKILKLETYFIHTKNVDIMRLKHLISDLPLCPKTLRVQALINQL